MSSLARQVALLLWKDVQVEVRAVELLYATLLFSAIIVLVFSFAFLGGAPPTVEVLAGVLWGGHGIAAMDLTIHLSPRRERAFYVAVFAATGGLGFAAASVAAGFLATHLPVSFHALGGTWNNIHVLFLLSALGRLVAAIAALRIEERNARGVRDLLRTVWAVG